MNLRVESVCGLTVVSTTCLLHIRRKEARIKTPIYKRNVEWSTRHSEETRRQNQSTDKKAKHSRINDTEKAIEIRKTEDTNEHKRE